MAFSRSLVPHLFRPSNDWWDIWDFPSRILDQNFGMILDDDTPPVLASPSPFYPLTRRLGSRSQVANRGTSEVSNTSDQFQVSVDVSAFAPNEVTVKAVDNNSIIIEAKHEERPDEHGYISRSFCRRYMLPKEVQIGDIKSNLTADGVLTVTAPKKALEPPKSNERVVPITMSPAAAPKPVQSSEQQQESNSKPTENANSN
ncbi:protein lethal(2)essential for life-like [Brevipalpus obovatus]|uniref:protein lethal(2)essential for life-like n=1 Tax=Brevipalpus obovatus TaxID=246614 RepID=UPI003D9F6D06